MTWRPGGRDLRALAPLVAAAAAAQGLLVILGPSLGAVATDLGAEVGAVGQARGVTAAVALAASVLLLRHVSSLGVRRIAVAGAVTALLSSLAVPASTVLATYLAAHVLVGLALAALLTTAFAGLAGFHGSRRAWAAGWVTAAGGAGWVVGSPGAGLLTEHVSWRATHVLPALLAAAVLVLARHCTGPANACPGTRYAAGVTASPPLLAPGTARLWIVAETLANVGWTSVLTFAGALLVVGLGVSEGLTGWLLAAGAACFVVASLVGGRLARTVDTRVVVVTTTSLLALLVALLLGTARLAPGAVATASAAVAFALSATAAGVRIPATSVLGMAQRPHRPEAMMAARTAAMQAGYLIGAALSGAVVAAAGWAALGPVLATVLAASALLTTRLAPPGPLASTAAPALPVPTTAITTTTTAITTTTTRTTPGGHP